MAAFLSRPHCVNDAELSSYIQHEFHLRMASILSIYKKLDTTKILYRSSSSAV